MTAVMRNATGRERGRSRSPGTSARRPPSSARSDVPARAHGHVHRELHGPQPAALVADQSRPLRRVLRRACGRPAGRGPYVLHSGIRSIAVVDGRLYINDGRSTSAASASTRTARSWASRSTTPCATRLVAETKALGATMMRTHYPPHPDLHELADREGILLWYEIPVYSLSNGRLADPALRARRSRSSSENVELNRNHPSVLAWSIGNELDSVPDATRPTTSTAPRRSPRSSTRRARPRWPSLGYVDRRLPGRLRAGRPPRHQRLLRLVPGPGRLDLRPRAALRLPRPMRALLPAQGDRGHGVRRRGQPRRPPRGEGHLCRAGGVRQLPPRRLRHQAVAQRRDLLGAQRVPHPPGAGRAATRARSRRSTRRGCSSTAPGSASRRGTTCERWYARTRQYAARAEEPPRGARGARPAAPAAAREPGWADGPVAVRGAGGASRSRPGPRSRREDCTASGSGIAARGARLGLAAAAGRCRLRRRRRPRPAGARSSVVSDRRNM